MCDQTKTRIDPELSRQLEAGEKADESVSGIIVLRPSAYATRVKGTASDIADGVESLAQEVVERVKGRVDDKSVKTNVLRNLGTVVFCGTSAFVRELIDQPEVESASANIMQEDLMIRPVGKPTGESTI